ncbi:MAG: hypothetical protein FWG82_02180 [Oscillospiraceae bacterium]|nr:hypothetical protein [Oscillospiraceae bacterium]
MKKIDLRGQWRLCAGKQVVQGHLPGCNYTDLYRGGHIPDPFVELNEYAVQEIARQDWKYLLEFDLDDDFLESDRIDLCLSGVDCLAAITLNGEKLAETNNAHRDFRLPCKDFLRRRNILEIDFAAPLTAVERLDEKRRVPQFAMSEPGAAQLRKPICHFGWDWGPVIAFSGVTGRLELEGYKHRLEDVRVEQTHVFGSAVLCVNARASCQNGNLRIDVTAPDSSPISQTIKFEDGALHTDVVIDDPQLWWCNGLGEQPLYSVKLELCDGETILDTWERKIGLRTIQLDTAPDKWGEQFRFIVNGVPIFAKGANWIPYDISPGRADKNLLIKLLEDAKHANMNMIRVWGGGYYESDEFYDLCDRLGLLVWQDCAFACAMYPLDDADYLANVKEEIEDNVKRLRHHASLALWCGNNEIQRAAWGYWRHRKLLKAHNDFFFKTLPEWINTHDGSRPYWPSSPCSSVKSPKNTGDLNRGDTHLWHVWHRCSPVEAYRKMPTRFCSEYGMESFPCRATIEKFAPKPESRRLLSAVMLSHQKCRSGNTKMRYYILSKFLEPMHFDDFCTLSQIMQGEAMRHAADFWRCNMGRCNGSLYWQYNDCWPTASWSGIDYYGEYKALQYMARRFNAPISAVALIDENPRKGFPLYVINETRNEFRGRLRCTYVALNGKGLEHIDIPIEAKPTQAAFLLHCKASVGPYEKVGLVLELFDENDVLIHTQTYLQVKDKEAHLLPPEITVTQVSERNAQAFFTLQTQYWARFVHLEIDGIKTPFSDNFFDIPSGKSVTISVAIPQGESAENLVKRLKIRSIADMEWKSTPHQDKIARLKILASIKTHNFKSHPLREWECAEKID